MYTQAALSVSETIQNLAGPGANNELYHALSVHLTGHTVKDQKMG